MSAQNDASDRGLSDATESVRARDQWIDFAAWALEDDAWHIATRLADLLGAAGAHGVAFALAQAERQATGRQAFVLNEARMMLLGAIERRWS